MTTSYVTKNILMKALQCKKKYWLYCNKMQEYDIEESNQINLDSGEEINVYAAELFGSIQYVNVEESLPNRVQETSRLIKQNSSCIAEASFLYNDFFCSVDFLVLNQDGVDIYEIKSSSSLKDIFVTDAAYHSYILQKCGITVNKVYVVTLNSAYVRKKEIDVHKLFAVHDVTKRAQAEYEVIEEAAVLVASKELGQEPDIDIGGRCFSPYHCGFFSYCTRHLPKENVFDIKNLRLDHKLEIYYEGLFSFLDIKNLYEGYNRLPPVVKDQLSKSTVVKNIEIQRYLSQFDYPRYYLDFETVQYAIPPYEGMYPFQQMPFQYSLHIQHKDGRLEHKEFLAADGYDCREDLVKRLMEDIPPNVCVIAYAMAFEKGVIDALALKFPEHYMHLMGIYNNMLDLMIPFKNHWYYNSRMQGSYSIKYVLPALFPNDPTLDYENLDGVKRGDQAMAAFKTLGHLDDMEKLLIRRQLLDYCALDTYAMVRIMDVLQEISA